MKADPKKDALAILSELDRPEFAALRAKHQGDLWEKYLNFDKYVPFNVRLCHQIGLHKTRPLRLLDIGCGGGLFMYCAKYYGHEPLGLDVEDKLLGEMAEAFGVERRIGPVHAFQPVSIEGRFDLISCIGTVFDWISSPGSDDGKGWTPREWRFFLSDLRSRLLTKDGRVYLRLNRGEEAKSKGEYFYDDRLRLAFEHGHLRSSEILLDRVGLDLAIDRLGRD